MTALVLDWYLLEDAASPLGGEEPYQVSAIRLAYSQAISLKRIADALSSSGIKSLLDIIANHPMNNYGEGFSEAIQNAIARGTNGINTNG